MAHRDEVLGLMDPKYGVDESKRPLVATGDMEVTGSFRKLNVDWTFFQRMPSLWYRETNSYRTFQTLCKKNRKEKKKKCFKYTTNPMNSFKIASEVHGSEFLPDLI